MNRSRSIFKIGSFAMALGLLPAHSVHACAACFGPAGNDVIGAISLAILFMLALLLGVLGGFICFFFYLKRQAEAPPPPYLEAIGVNYHEGLN
jgi:hypothetical protein